MRAQDDDLHSIRDDTDIIVAGRVFVADIWADAVDLVVADIYTDRPLQLNATVRVESVSPGVLAVGNAKGHWVRLDAHLSAEEKHDVVARRGGYFGLDETVSPDQQGRERHE